MQKDLERVFIETLDRNKDRLYRICKSYSTSLEEGKDLYQEVLLNTWKSLKSFKGEASIDTWIFRIALNVCLRAREFSAKRQKSFIRIDSIKYENIPEIKSETNESEIKKLYACIRKLEGVDKSIILLYLEDQPYKEIAAILGLSENHIAVKVKRIKNKLFTCLKP